MLLNVYRLFISGGRFRTVLSVLLSLNRFIGLLVKLQTSYSDSCFNLKTYNMMFFFNIWGLTLQNAYICNEFHINEKSLVNRLNI